MKCNWNIGFEWMVTGAAVIGVIVLLIYAEGKGAPIPAQELTQSVGNMH